MCLAVSIIKVGCAKHTDVSMKTLEHLGRALSPVADLSSTCKQTGASNGCLLAGGFRYIQRANRSATSKAPAASRLKTKLSSQGSCMHNRALPVSDETSEDRGSTNDIRVSPPKIAIAVLLLAAAALAVYLFGAKHLSLKDIAASLDELVRSYGPWGAVIFVSAFVAATLVLIPSTALTLAAGYLFGPSYGTVLVSLASTIGASLAFLISRYLAQPYAKAKLQQYPKLESIEQQVSSEGIKLVLLLRLAPLVPFTVLNYALGVTDISFVSYIFATWLGKLPGVFSSVYVGSTGRSIDAATNAGGIDKVSFTLNVIGVIASVLVTKLLADKASGVLNNDIDDSTPSN